MALVVEDGSVVSGANTYVDAAWAAQYFALRGNSSWPTELAAQESALIQAADYIEARFDGRFIGCRVSEIQALSWPRKDTRFAKNEIPETLKRAQCEYAVRASVGPLIPDVSFQNGFAVIQTGVKVGPIEKDFAVAASGAGSRLELFPPIPAADILISSLLEWYRQGEVIR